MKDFFVDPQTLKEAKMWQEFTAEKQRMTAEIERLKKENERLNKAIEYQEQKYAELDTKPSDFQIMENQVEIIEQLKSKLKVAKETLIDLKAWGYKTQWETIDTALKEIE